MPLVTIKVIEGVFTSEQKQQMIDRVTDAMISVEGENMRPVTWVLVDDNVKSGDWGIGGHGLTVADVHAVASGKAKAPSI
ncbi:MAG TPA: 4-oxalocrotonate tautomerase family protein [Nitrolancea sp.]|nr:4-oxalocrotonate tautomerase family protein [Nitrolancea sp.]